MSNLIRYAVVLTLAISGMGLQRLTPGQTTPQRKTIRKAPTGSVSGRITIHGKGKAGIPVGMRAVEFGRPPGSIFKNTTDAEGNYHITNVPAGNYLVAPIAPAFVVSDLSSFGERGKALLLAEGESVDGIDFSLVRGGVITGKVTNADGRPVIEERVYLVPVDPTATNQRGAYQFNGVQTDDRGIYRMFGLDPGRYKVAVGQSGDRPSMNGMPGRPSYQQTFHPDVSDISKATVVEVTEGSETSKVDLTLGRAAQTYVASGRIIDGESEQPVANARLGLQMTIDSRRRSFGGGTTISNRQGEFRLENLTPGKYMVFLLPQPESSLRVVEGAFDIIDRDVEGVVVKTANGATLSGNILLENSDDKAVLAKLPQLRVEAYVESDGPGFDHRATISADGSFRLSGLETGKAYISLAAPDRGILKGFSVSRIERDGIAQTDGILVSPREEVTGIRLIVSYGNASIRGVVKAETGDLPTNARIFLRSTKAGETMSHIQPPVVDARGHFMLDGLVGGTYDLVITVVVPGRQRGQWEAKQQVTVAEGVVTEVTITVNLDQKTSP
ncbi:MAG: carboxypeptidase regulatory-like domain-containing protein [Acidobacteriota bacterium]|nr:carboxypeptidase regulatory-like domain-containing protein [Acidobacteriota bacterium]